MNTYWRQISNNLQNKVNSGTFKVWIAPLQAELLFTDRSHVEPVSSVPVTSTPALKGAHCPHHENEKNSSSALGTQTQAAPDAVACLHLSAPNEFVAGWVRDRLSDLIQLAAEEVLQGKVDLSITAAIQPPTAPLHSLSLQEDVASAEPIAQQALALTASDAQPSARLSPLPAPQTRTVGEQLCLPVRAAKSDFSWRYGFDGFVVGPCNDMAYAAARNMLPDHGAVDTLFLSSGPGLGKTHLTQAVGRALCQAANRRPKVEYLSAESFSSAFVQALKARDIDAFKARFRDVDVLLLEDVHFLQGKEKMQIEVLSTVKALQERGSRVVLTSAFAPRELGNLDPTLVSRFCSGFLAGMEKPDFPTRRRILQDKAVKTSVHIPDDVCDLMAERLTGDVRQLESCLNNLLLRARLQGCDLSLSMAAEILAQYAQESPFMDLEAITRRVCEGFGLSPEQLMCRSRRNAHVTARNTVFYLARKHTDLSLQDIGEHFNRRHSTVLKGIAAVDREITRETPLGRQIASTLSIIESRVKSKGRMM